MPSPSKAKPPTHWCDHQVPPEANVGIQEAHRHSRAPHHGLVIYSLLCMCHGCERAGGLNNLPKGTGQTLHSQLEPFLLETDKSLSVLTRCQATLPFPTFEAASVSGGPYLEPRANSSYIVPFCSEVDRSL